MFRGSSHCSTSPLHTEGFSLYVHTGPPTQGTSTEDLANTTRSTQLLSPTKQLLHKRLDTTITSTLRGMGTKPNNDHLTQEG